ncbi:siderophore-iron reductase FhuF [Shinella sp. BYT-45]|uniref:siderophore-iron reductase FhuF n=1 Tax=Shinella sp. BYT-45 TaxID=3377377 RepID=UPI003980C7F9
MIASLAGAFAPPFQWYGGHLELAGGDDADAVRPLDMPRIAALVARFETPFSAADRRAAVSLWSQYYFAALIVPTVAVAARLGRTLPVEITRVRLRAAEDGTPAAFLLASDGEPIDEAGPAPLSVLLENHLIPFIETMSSAFGVTARLLWSNAATVLEWSLFQAGTDGAASGRVLQHGLAMLKAQTLPDGRRNPLFGQVRYPLENGVPVRRRRVCCLRYLLPGEEACGSLCPLPDIRKA